MKQLRKLPSAYLATEIDGELIMVRASTGGFLSLKNVGLAIWQALDEEPDLSKICAKLESEYDVAPEICCQSVQEFAEQLVTAGIAEYC